MSHFFAFLARMKLIHRWGLMRNSQMENIQEHSLQVALIAHALAVIKQKRFGGNIDPERVLTLAIFHDASEVITGDLATPIKYFNPEICKAYKSIEVVAKQKLLDMLDDELRTEYHSLFFMRAEEEASWRLIKAADKISAYIKCVEELKTGNQEFSKAETAIRKQIDAMEMDEVTYFMDKYIPSFSLTLDELE